MTLPSSSPSTSRGRPCQRPQRNPHLPGTLADLPRSNPWPHCCLAGPWLLGIASYHTRYTPSCTRPAPTTRHLGPRHWHLTCPTTGVGNPSVSHQYASTRPLRVYCHLGGTPRLRPHSPARPGSTLRGSTRACHPPASTSTNPARPNGPRLDATPLWFGCGAQRKTRRLATTHTLSDHSHLCST